VLDATEPVALQDGIHRADAGLLDCNHLDHPATDLCERSSCACRIGGVVFGVQNWGSGLWRAELGDWSLGCFPT
jgi:hypothetical protein